MDPENKTVSSDKLTVLEGTMKRKKFSTEFKAKVAIEAIKGHLTANEIASELRYM